MHARMSRLRRRDNDAEIALRRVLHAEGLRFRVHVAVPGNARRSIDVALTRARLAVFVDGCFWHACPEHGTDPRTNSEWWQWKLRGNVERDRDTDRLLEEAGWEVLRVWEHEDPTLAGARIREAWSRRVQCPASSASSPGRVQE